MYQLHLPSYVSFIIVGCLWGCTNPFLKKGQEKVNESSATKEKDCDVDEKIYKSSIWKWKIWNMCTSSVGIPFLINQSGSLMFYILLSTEPLGTTVPVVNCLTFVFTALTSIIINGEKVDSPVSLVFGTIMVLLGMYLCANA